MILRLDDWAIYDLEFGIWNLEFLKVLDHFSNDRPTAFVDLRADDLDDLTGQDGPDPSAFLQVITLDQSI